MPWEGEVDEEDLYRHYPTYATYYECAQPSWQGAFDDFVAGPLSRPWHPLEAHELPEFVAYSYVPQMTYHRTLLEDFADTT